ncbi:MAG: flagellar hook-basal body complex protein, partial [Spirochaetota bacterium]
PSTTKAVEQDGYGMGYMESFNIDSSGVITGVYSNGIKQPVGQVAMSVFTNPQGLTAVGENLFEVSNNSGMANTGAANSAGRGKINAGSLEMSNVDLSDQFTDMIVTQRGFQANSRTITTSDQMLQEVINLKR